MRSSLFVSSLLYLASSIDPATGLTTASSPGQAACSGCYAVAPIDQIILGGGTSYSISLGSFTWHPTATLGITNGAQPNIPYATPLIINDNTTITGPVTMYNVIQSTYLVALINSGGICTVTTIFDATIAGRPAILIPSLTKGDFVLSAESQFLNENANPELQTCSTIGGTSVVGVFLTAVPTATASTQASAISIPSQSIRMSTSFSTSAATAAAATSSAASSSSASVQSTDSGLSQSAKIGIGVGVGIGAALILAALGFVLWRRSTAKKHVFDEKARTNQRRSTGQVLIQDEPGVAVD